MICKKKKKGYKGIDGQGSSQVILFERSSWKDLDPWIKIKGQDSKIIFES